MMSTLCFIAEIVKFCEKTSFFPHLTENFIIPIIKWFIFAITVTVVRVAHRVLLIVRTQIVFFIISINDNLSFIPIAIVIHSE